jgi:hypothetical protein
MVVSTVDEKSPLLLLLGNSCRNDEKQLRRFERLNNEQQKNLLLSYLAVISFLIVLVFAAVFFDSVQSVAAVRKLAGDDWAWIFLVSFGLTSIIVAIMVQVERAQDAKADLQETTADLVREAFNRLDTNQQAARAEIRADLQAAFNRLDTNQQAARAEIRADLQAADTNQQAARAEIRAELREARTEIRADLREAFNRLDTNQQASRAEIRADLHIMGTHITRHDTRIDGVYAALAATTTTATRQV